MKIFYYDAEADAEVVPENPLDVPCERLSDAFDDISAEDGSFLGLILEDGRILQFIYDGDDLRLDIPDPSMGGSWSMLVDQDSALEIAERTCVGADPMLIVGLEFEGW